MGECERKLQRTAQLCERAQLSTSPAGQEMLKRELSSLRGDFAAMRAHADDVKQRLQTALAHWQDYEVMSVVKSV